VRPRGESTARSTSASDRRDLAVEQPVQQRLLAVGGQVAVGQRGPQLRLPVDDALEPEQLVFDLVELVVLLGLRQRGFDRDGFERVDDVARLGPAAASGLANEVERPVADLAGQQPVGQPDLGVGLQRRVGDRPAQRRLVSEQRHDREQILGQPLQCGRIRRGGTGQDVAQARQRVAGGALHQPAAPASASARTPLPTPAMKSSTS
jgi:hypothetical protein